MAGFQRIKVGALAFYSLCIGFLIFVLILHNATANSDQGILEIRLKDHREAIGDFLHLNIAIDQIAISPKVGYKFWQVSWEHLVPAVPAVDLTRYSGGESVRIFRGAVKVGAFDAVHLKLRSVEGMLKKGRQNAKVKNLVGPVKLRFEVHPQSQTLIILDLVVLDMSDHPPRAYEIGVKGYELYTNGKLIDRIPPG